MDKDIRCKVLTCDCICPQQDKLYGKGKRLHNKTKNDEWRCTSCRKERR